MTADSNISNPSAIDSSHPEPARLAPSPLDVAIRKLQQAHAVTLVAERAATHDLVSVDCLADVFVAILPLIDGALAALDSREAAS